VQIHLLTAVLLTAAAGTLIGLNMRQPILLTTFNKDPRTLIATIRFPQWFFGQSYWFTHTKLI